MKRWLLSVALLPAFCLADAGQDAGVSFEAEAKQRLQGFQLGLKQALKSGLAEGPVAAIERCQIQAPAIAEGAASDGWSAGRSSDRLRNPNNQAPKWLAPVLADYMANPEQAARVVELDDGAKAYVAPIRMQGMCLGCHGEQLSPEVSAELQQRYPDDHATGYQLGDFRGLFWLRKETVTHW